MNYNYSFPKRSLVCLLTFFQMLTFLLTSSHIHNFLFYVMTHTIFKPLVPHPCSPIPLLNYSLTYLLIFEYSVHLFNPLYHM